MWVYLVQHVRIDGHVDAVSVVRGAIRGVVGCSYVSVQHRDRSNSHSGEGLFARQLRHLLQHLRHPFSAGEVCKAQRTFCVFLQSETAVCTAIGKLVGDRSGKLVWGECRGEVDFAAGVPETAQCDSSLSE